MNDNQQIFTPDELQLIDLVVKTPTISKTKLAEVMNLSRNTIIKIYNRDHVKEEIQKHQISNIERFTELQSEALDVIEELFDSEDPSIRLQAARPFIEALKVTKVEHSGSVGVNGRIQIVIEPVKPQDFKELNQNNESPQIPNP